MPLNSLNNVNTIMWLCRDKLVLICLFKKNTNGACTRMAFHIQSVSQLALQARRRARAQGRWGASPWLPSPQTERWKQVCLCVNTAMMLLETQQAAIPLLGRSPRGHILDFVHVERRGGGGRGRDQQCRWHSVKEKKKRKKEKKQKTILV